MRTETKHSWWRELGAVSQGMLFLDGHIASTEALRASGEHRPTRRPVPPERHERALRVLHARRRREMTALSLFR